MALDDSLDHLLKDFMQLWQQQCADAFRDPHCAKIMKDSYSAAMGFLNEFSFPNSTTSAPEFLAPLAAQLVELNKRIEHIEKRLSVLESSNTAATRTRAKSARKNSAAKKTKSTAQTSRK